MSTPTNIQAIPSNTPVVVQTTASPSILQRALPPLVWLAVGFAVGYYQGNARGRRKGGGNGGAV